MKPQDTKHATNGSAWAIGQQRHNGGFHVRKVVWGLLMAQCERRDGEQVRAAHIMVERSYKPRAQVAPELNIGAKGGFGNQTNEF